VLSSSATTTSVFHVVSSHVYDLGRDKIHPFFLLDEAHLLHQDTLDHLHILLNYEWDILRKTPPARGGVLDTVEGGCNLRR
jgi:hypothetical protein